MIWLSAQSAANRISLQRAKIGRNIALKSPKIWKLSAKLGLSCSMKGDRSMRLAIAFAFLALWSTTVSISYAEEKKAEKIDTTEGIIHTDRRLPINRLTQKRISTPVRPNQSQSLPYNSINLNSDGVQRR